MSEPKFKPYRERVEELLDGVKHCDAGDKISALRERLLVVENAIDIIQEKAKYDYLRSSMRAAHEIWMLAAAVQRTS